MKEIGNRIKFGFLAFAVALSAAMLGIGTAGASITGGSNVMGVSYATQTPLVSTTYTVANQPDSGYGGYWALDTYSQTLNIWQISSGVYAVNATDNGQSCTQAGLPDTNNGTNTQVATGCTSIVGGFDGVLTTPVSLSTSTPLDGQTIEMGGTFGQLFNQSVSASESDIIATWLNNYFPGATETQFSMPDWGWIYKVNGETWIDSASVSQVNSGDIFNASESGTTGTVTVVPATCPLSITPSTINFGSSLIAGSTSLPQTVTVTNNGNVATDVLVSGADWSFGSGTVGDTLWTTGSGFMPLGYTPVDTMLSLGVGGHSSSLSFELSLPASVLPGTYSQQIFILSSC